tara:strand:- start:285 stop:731 length:447 start_codon:yes stop_codon:yes gene_type:complete
MSRALLIFILTIIINGCSYTPMLTKNYDFQFSNISSNGERYINEIITNILNEKGKGSKKFDIIFNTRQERLVVSSNDKGDAKIYRLSIYVDYEVFQENKKIIENKFVKYLNYNNINDKFELSKYEENVIENLSETISSEILMSIISMV